MQQGPGFGWKRELPAPPDLVLADQVLQVTYPRPQLLPPQNFLLRIFRQVGKQDHSLADGWFSGNPGRPERRLQRAD